MPFRDIVGHHRLIGLLRRSLAGGTLPPSLIFAGPSGIGKRKTALAVAQALNCLRTGTNNTEARVPSADSRTPNAESPANPESANPESRIPNPEYDACGVCLACTRIARGVHPDVLVAEPGDTGTIRIDQVREIVDRAGYRPFEGRRRAVIIDEADALVVPAQHALLKTLEEPPPSSVFILVTSRPDVLLPTVRSRCPQLRFRPLSAGDITAALVRRGHSESDARAVAATADGSLGHALQASAGDLVEARDVAQRVLAQASAQPDAARRIAGAQALLAKTGAGGAGDRDQLASHLRAMASLLRDVEVLGTDADAGALANPDVRPALERLAPAYRGERGVRAFAAIDQALVALERNAGVKVVADWLVLQL
jgi:DNA polymerase-3 subunit delta'